MNERNRTVIFKLIGLAISTVLPLSAVITYFPLWKERGAATMVSGISLCLILVSIIPIVRYLKYALKSPSATTVWFVLFVLFFFLSRIAEDMTVISMIGFISNLVGSFFFYLAKSKEEKK